MRPLGKRYLVLTDPSEEQVLEGGIIVPKQDSAKLAHFKGRIQEIGIGFDRDHDNLLQIGDHILFDWAKREDKTKLLNGGRVRYILSEDLVLAKIQE